MRAIGLGTGGGGSAASLSDKLACGGRLALDGLALGRNEFTVALVAGG
jgi:hypothetical protein